MEFEDRKVNARGNVSIQNPFYTLAYSFFFVFLRPLLRMYLFKHSIVEKVVLLLHNQLMFDIAHVYSSDFL